MKNAKTLGDILAEYLSASGLRNRSRLSGVYQAWAGAAGEPCAAHSRVEGVRRGVLYVSVDSAACLQEMVGFRKAEILAALVRHKGCEHIHDIRFKHDVLEPE
ncbi:MAG: DUF721 domain-containing protein [Planctomycetes bacterium]|nr:DUF721 domain-containing protein [Planctomycetota bacterium]